MQIERLHHAKYNGNTAQQFHCVAASCNIACNLRSKRPIYCNSFLLELTSNPTLYFPTPTNTYNHNTTAYTYRRTHHSHKREGETWKPPATHAAREASKLFKKTGMADCWFLSTTSQHAIWKQYYYTERFITSIHNSKLSCPEHVIREYLIQMADILLATRQYQAITFKHQQLTMDSQKKYTPSQFSLIPKFRNF